MRASYNLTQEQISRSRQQIAVSEELFKAPVPKPGDWSRQQE